MNATSVRRFPVKPGVNATLRLCASCRLVFKRKSRHDPECPYCGFGSYSAHWALGKSCYREAVKQTEWREAVAQRVLNKITEMVNDGNSTPVLDRPLNAETLWHWLQGENKGEQHGGS